jgi:hypothetical protein
MGQFRGIPIVTGKQAHCFWGTDLAAANAVFLKSLDPGYFSWVVKALEPSEDHDKADRRRGSIALRLAHGQALETLFALLAATAQAPRFPAGWMMTYRNSDLRDVVTAIHSATPFLTVLREQPVTWNTLSTLVHAHLPDPPLKKRNLAHQFGRVWHRLAGLFLKESMNAEYNSIKHGLRVQAGGFSISIGAESTPGERATPDQMPSLGCSEFGSSYFTATRIPPYKHHFVLTHAARNWRPGH